MTESNTQETPVLAITDSPSSSEQQRSSQSIELELRRLRASIVLSAILISGFLAAFLVAITGIDWFYPTIFFFVVAYVAWNHVGA